jgi:hypothetical protein
VLRVSHVAPPEPRGELTLRKLSPAGSSIAERIDPRAQFVKHSIWSCRRVSVDERISVQLVRPRIVCMEPALAVLTRPAFQ